MVVHLRHQSIVLPFGCGARKDKVADGETRTALAWLREWPEAPLQKSLAGIVERLQLLRALGIGPDRERRIHRARYAAIARETAILSAQHLYRFDEQRRLATLVVFAREMEVELTDAALIMFDKMMAGCSAKQTGGIRTNWSTGPRCSTAPPARWSAWRRLC